MLQGALLSTLGATLGGAGTYYYAKNIEPTWFEITQHQLRLPQLTDTFHGYRIVHITDIHADNAFMTASRLAGIVETVNGLRADLIVITGDFVSYYFSAMQQVLTELSRLQAKDGVFGVLGNHDHPTGAELVRACLVTANVTELGNKTHTIKRGNEMLHIVGMDDLWPTNRGLAEPIETHIPLLNQLTATLPDNGAAILLVHEPDFADITAQNPRYSLQLSGHSHGGQVRIPFRGPIILPQLSHNYPLGMYRINNLYHYTNRGLGMIKPYFRFVCRPEIAVFELQGH